VSANDGQEPRERAPRGSGYGGLCPSCLHLKLVTSGKGTTFLLCRRAADDARYAKYPPQPVVRCAGHEARAER